MASNRKIWKTRKVSQIIFITTFFIMLILAIYSMKEKHSNKPTEFHNYKTEKSSLNLDPSSYYVKVVGSNEIIDKALTEPAVIGAFPGYKIVHLDLKGAPPKPSYYEEFFPFIKKLGATGVLVEYEDMFPYRTLDIAANNSYSLDDINNILKLANDSSLEVIPLIQTFGHLEFVLKLEKYKHLREDKKYPQAICPSKTESLNLLMSIIDEILEAHKDIRYLHIGCDEVFHIGKCSDCRKKLETYKWTTKQLTLNHITTLARYIHKKTEGKVKPLIWDDELRSISLVELQKWNIGNLVEPVVWKYTTDIEDYLTEDLWQKYIVVFKAVWFASAFKGAKYPNSITASTRLYFDNHKAWMGLVNKYSHKLLFRGGVLTGWQRYDHFAVLCELLPVSIPSLALNLIYLSTEVKTLIELSVRMQRACGCDANPLMATAIHSSCTFPGACLYITVQQIPSIMATIKRDKDENYYRGWMSPYNIEYTFSNPSFVEFGTNKVFDLYGEVNELEREIRICMKTIYDNSTIEEWIFTYLKPLKDELKFIAEAREKILAKESWPKRPLFH